MTFAGIGAIVFSHHAPAGEMWALLLAAALAGLAGALVALPALRLSGIELALATAAFAVAMQVWVFLLPPFDFGPWTVRFFEFGTIPVVPVDVPGVDTVSRKGQLVFIATVFAALYLVVVAIRRGGFGQRLIALKTSPAAAATLGLDLTRLKLAVFGLSGAIAGVGGALYGGTLGSIGPETFTFFESLPLLLLAVVGGIGSASGALFAGFLHGGAPIAISTWPAVLNPNRVLPGLMGLSMGRTPNGAVTEITEAYRPVGAVRPVLVSAVGATALLIGLRGGGVIDSWPLVIGIFVVLLVAPAAAGAVVSHRDRTARAAELGAPPVEVPLEWAGVTAAFGDGHRAALDEVVPVARVGT
jgi:branched-chain amino acid transport system permease protein